MISLSPLPCHPSSPPFPSTLSPFPSLPSPLSPFFSPLPLSPLPPFYPVTLPLPSLTPVTPPLPSSLVTPPSCTPVTPPLPSFLSPLLSPLPCHPYSTYPHATRCPSGDTATLVPSTQPSSVNLWIHRREDKSHTYTSPSPEGRCPLYEALQHSPTSPFTGQCLALRHPMCLTPYSG